MLRWDVLSHDRSFGEEEEYPTLEEALAIELMMHDNEHGYFAGNVSELSHSSHLDLPLKLSLSGILMCIVTEF